MVDDLLFASDPNEKPEWFLPDDPEPSSPSERRALQFVVEFMSDFGGADLGFVEHVEGFREWSPHVMTNHTDRDKRKYK